MDQAGYVCLDVELVTGYLPVVTYALTVYGLLLRFLLVEGIVIHSTHTSKY